MVPWRFFKNLSCSSGCIWIWSTSFKVPIIQHNPTILSRVFPKSSKSWGYPQIIQVPSPTKFYATENVTWGSREGPGLPGPPDAPSGRPDIWLMGLCEWKIIGKSNAKPVPNWSEMDGIKWYQPLPQLGALRLAFPDPTVTILPQGGHWKLLGTRQNPRFAEDFAAAPCWGCSVDVSNSCKFWNW